MDKKPSTELSSVKPEKEDLDLEGPKTKKWGERMRQLCKTLIEAGEDGDIEDKAEFLLEESKYQEPELSDFIGKKPYYTRESVRNDEKYVKAREKDFTPDQRLAKIAEAIIGQAIRGNELIECVGGIRTIISDPVTRYDDISGGIDQAVTLITEKGQPKPFGFDVTIGRSKKTFVKKLFRPYRDSQGNEQDLIGFSRLKYGQEPTLDEKGNYKSIECKTIDFIPRFTIALSEDEVVDMTSNVDVEEGYAEGDVEVYANPDAKITAKIIHQLYEQAVFYSESTRVNLEETRHNIKKEQDPNKLAELKAKEQTLIEQLKKLRELTTTLEPAFKQSYVRARKETIPNKNNAKPDGNIRRTIMCAGYIGTHTGAFIDTIHRYEGYEGDYDEQEDKLIEQYIEESLDECSKKYHRENPNATFEPNYSASLIASIEFDAIMKAKRQMRAKFSHRMQECLDIGEQEYDQIIIEEQNARAGIAV